MAGTQGFPRRNDRLARRCLEDACDDRKSGKCRRRPARRRTPVHRGSGAFLTGRSCVNEILIGKSDEPVYLSSQYGNRHGLVAGATGTGKTVSLLVIAEGFSR